MKTLTLIALSFAVASLQSPAQTQELRKIVVAYPNGGFNWPLFIAKDADYFRKYGIDANLVFSVHPAGVAMVVSGEAQVDSYALEPLMIAASKDRSLVLICSQINRGVFALMTRADIRSVRDLKGKRIAIGQIGDANYGYSSVVLRQVGLSPRNVEWVPLGPDTGTRIAALVSGRVDATLLTAPAFFKLEAAGFRNLVNFADREDLFASAALLMKRSVISADPDLPVSIIRAQAEAIKRFYDDRSFAVNALLHYNPNTSQADAQRLYDLYAKPQAFERVPFLESKALTSAIEQESDPRTLEQLKMYDFRNVIDNSFVHRLVKEGFFQQMFGTDIKKQQNLRAKEAFN